MTVRRATRGSASIRRSSVPARRRAIRRASAGFNRTRWLALLVIILSGLALYGANSSTAFGYRRLVLTGESFTPVATIRSELRAPDEANLFRLSTDGMVERLRALPTVADASVEIALPDTLRVRITERTAVVIWQVAGRRLLVDADGVAFALAAGPTDLPIVDDRRAPMAPPADPHGLDLAERHPEAHLPVVGDRIDPVDFDAAARLGSLRPADVGSGAAALQVKIDDEHGFTISTGKDGWTAIFGFYTPTIRRTELIPGQVRLLAGLLAGREETVARVLLADDGAGTYTLKATR
ncbi:MAG: FtsQ-type POTRA domain-containing protein [Chloroflexota bacterium]|nr:FtsQ-type POTRA domain-containing protein [Chloroflexota bacterium]